jgi:hypothetical protein
VCTLFLKANCGLSRNSAAGGPGWSQALMVTLWGPGRKESQKICFSETHFSNDHSSMCFAIGHLLRFRCNFVYFRTRETLPWYGPMSGKCYAALHWYHVLHLTSRSSVINPVLCLLRNMTPDLFPLQDINFVYFASNPFLNSCLSFPLALKRYNGDSRVVLQDH